VPQLDRVNLFIWARDWTGIDENFNGIPDSWEWRFFGNFNQPTNGDYDSDGIDNLTEYLRGNDPNKIRFSLQFPNDHVNTGMACGTITVLGGVPARMAVLVNDTNLADADWEPNISSNILVNLTAGNGNYTISVGLRGLPQDAQQTWQWARLVLDTTPPTITVTNPTAGVVSQPMIQVQGYASEPLGGLTFDVSNVAGVFTNQTGFLTGQFYDTNLLAYTTNYFQCPDIDLVNGTNLITLHAADWAGNTTNISFTFNYFNTNPPALTVIWPQPDTAISGSSFTLQVQVDNTTAKITASIVGSSDDTNVVQGLVENNGSVWMQNLPLSAGTNSVTVTATGLNGSISVTNFDVVQNEVGLVIYPLEDYQLNQSSVSVFGEVGDPSLCVWVNGVQATVNDDGTWEADYVQVSPVGTASLSVQVYVGDPVLVASQNFYQAQPVTVGMMSYSGRHEFSSSGSTETINWFYQTGGNYTGDGGNFEISSNENGVAYAYLSWITIPFVMPWEYASLTVPQIVVPGCGGPFGNYTQTRVMVEPGGQTLAGTKNLYLVLANASEFSTLKMNTGSVAGNYGQFYVSMIAGMGTLVNYLGYFGDVPLPPEWLQIRGQTLINSGITNGDGSVSGMTLVSAPAGVNWDVTPVATQVYQNLDYTFNMQAFDVTPRMLVDNSHSGNLNSLTTPNSPYRFWINDSKESGDDESSGGADDQIPGQSYFNANYSLTHVNGSSDLVNFFPVALCLSNVLQWLPPTNGCEYHLMQNDAGLPAGMGNGALKFVYTSLSPTNAFDYLTNTAGFGYGTNADEWATNADTIQVRNTPGTVLDTNWLAMVQNNGGYGVVLLEGCVATKQPLMLEIWHNGQKMGGVPLYLSISGVEQMFRHYNMCAYGNGTVDTGNPGNPSRYDAPNEPVRNGKNLVFLPGYNVNQQQSRGVESEMFKRFYWSRSKAKFYGVTWNGAVSQGDMSGGGVIAELKNVTCNYQTNVVNALLTAPHLADFLNNGLSGETTVAAHSLGNMVVLSAISDYGATHIAHYFMIDAAVPMEAIQGDMAYNPDMVYSTWQQYSNRIFASDWWQLFTNDYRSTLTWSNRLGNLGSVDIYNFFSSGEEVLRWDPVDPPSGILGGASSQLVNYWIEGVPWGTYTWVWQEKGKGTAAHDWFIGSTHGGWKFNDYWGNPPPSPTIMNDTAASTLQDYPMFSVGSTENGPPDQDLRSDEYGSGYAQAHRDRILSDAIPALTLPVGANAITNLDIRAGSQRNFDMQGSFETGWPSTRSNISTDPEAYNWHHSDFDYVAYPFTYKLFNQIVTVGNLK
jgi:hypothetical protein